MECKGHQNDPAIAHRILQKLAFRPKQNGNGPQEHKTDDRKNDTQAKGNVNKQRKIAVRAFMVPHAEGLRHNGAAAGTEHKAHRGHDHQHRENQIHRREGGLSREIGNKKAVHNAINGHEDHHADGRHGKADQPPVGKVIRQLDLRFHTFLPIYKNPAIALHNNRAHPTSSPTGGASPLHYGVLSSDDIYFITSIIPKTQKKSTNE